MPPQAAEEAIDALLASARLWRGRGGSRTGGGVRHVPSGHAELDALLPEGGWPECGLIDLLIDEHGIGELQIVMPLLRGASSDAATAREERWIAWLAPPFLPYAPALRNEGLMPERQLIVRTLQTKEVWWAMEQVLRSGTCAAVLGWVGKAEGHALRRLKLAAEQGGSAGLLFRPTRYRSQASPANLRAVLRGIERDAAPGLEIEVIKSQGGRTGRVQVSASGLGVIG
jgi:cell division inhibitor SulA/protein ImuA